MKAFAVYVLIACYSIAIFSQTLKRKTTRTSQPTVTATGITPKTERVRASDDPVHVSDGSGPTREQCKDSKVKCEARDGNGRQPPVCTGKTCHCSEQANGTCRMKRGIGDMLCGNCAELCSECAQYQDQKDLHKKWYDDNKINVCDPNPCLNGGTCRPGNPLLYPDKHECDCETGHDPTDNCNVCEKGTFGDKCYGICGRCGIYKNTKELYCHPVGGCTYSCSPYWYDKPYCDKVNCNAARVDGKNPCAPGVCKNERCVCPPSLYLTSNTLYHGPCGGPKDNFLTPQKGVFRACNGLYCNIGTCYLVGPFEVPMCDCPPGYYMNITNPLMCIRGCKENTETCLNGRCVRGECVCNGGYKGQTCDEKCKIHEYGPYCKEICGECRILPCEGSSGACLNLFDPTNTQRVCAEGFKPPDCKEMLARSFTKAKFTARILLNYDGQWVHAFNIRNSVSRQVWDKFVPVIINDAACYSVHMLCTAKVIKYLEGSVQAVVMVGGNFTDGFRADGLEKRFKRSIQSAAKEVPPPKGYSFKNVQVLDVFRQPEDIITGSDGSEKTTTLSTIAIIAIAFAGVVVISTIIISVACKLRQKNRKSRRMRPRQQVYYPQAQSQFKVRSAPKMR